jgi:S1-C subfamily serine protease
MAIAIGSPFRNFNSVTIGVVSGTGRGPTSTIQRPIPDMIQTDAALNPGNSGGPLLNARGEVIGVTSAVRTGNFQGIGDYRIGFAVPSNTVQHLMPELLAGSEVRRPWLGVSGVAITPELAESIGVAQGIVVLRVLRDSPAEAVGLTEARSLQEPGDIIVSVDGVAVSSVEEMVSYFNTLRPGDVIALGVIRDGLPSEISVTLDPWPEDNT